MQDALNEYNRLISAPEGDDWLISELGRADLFFLIARLLRRPDICHPWLYARCREVEASPYGHLDLWARGHFKSTIITFGLTIQDILVDPTITTGIFSHTRPIAKSFLRQIKTEFEGNEDLKTLYPDVLWKVPKRDAPKWSEDDGIVVRRATNTKESTVEAWGLVDGMPTGKHFRKLLYDDVVVKDSVNNPDIIKKTTEALELSFNLGVDGGPRLFVGTRYHYNDSYRVVIDRGIAKIRLYDGTEGNSGNIKKPALMSVVEMAEKRRDMGPYTFGTQILQNPKGDENEGFKREWLRHYRNVEPRGLNKYILVDAANSKREGSDYTAMWVVGLGADNNYHVLDIVRDRLKLGQRASRLIELHKQWRPLQVRYEEYGLQADIEHIESEQEKLTYRFKIKAVGGRVKKEDRIKRLLPLFEQGRIWLPTSLHLTNYEGETRDMVRDFIEEEYAAFPVGLHDDMLDALARIAEPDTVKGKVDSELTLKWPAKLRTMAPRTPTWGQAVQGVI